MNQIKILYSIVAIFLFQFAFTQKKLELSAVWASPVFFQKSVDEVASMNDGEHYTVLEEENRKQVINKYSYKTFEKVATLVNEDDLQWNGSVISFDSYEFNADETKLLLTTETEYIYRRSFLAQYFIYDLKSKKISPLADASLGKQMLAEISPDGLKVAYVRNNNIYYREIDSKDEVEVTNDGERNKIINGSTDWVYEEEFSITKGFYWSPDSKKIAYYKFDESNVKEFQFDVYEGLYPDRYIYKYPKAGEDNSVLTIHYYDLINRKTRPILTGTDSDIYLPRMKWDNFTGSLIVLRLNRLQNKLDYCTVDFNVPPSELPKLVAFYTETNEAYVEITDDLIFLEKTEGFLRSSEKDGYNHIYKVDYNGKESQITKGNWDVISLLGIDEKNGWIYYLSAESSPMQKDLYRIKPDGTKKTKLSLRKGSNDATFSKGMKYFINYNSSANVPNYVTLHTADGKELKVLEDNKTMIENLKQYELSGKTFFTFKTDQNNELNGWMIKPNNFDVNKKYPVYLTFYGGPGHNEVVDSWDGPDYGFYHVLAQKGYLVVCVDPRGTLFRGEKFKKCTYLQLGKYETEDLIETAKYLGKQSYVEASRIGVQGWSYGGYMTLLCMTKGADYFKAGVAIAPVTNWRYYDNIYTERFMRKPQENAKGYDDNSPINHVNKLKGKLLIVHGSADDNVHVQNTMEISNAFIKQNKPFEMFIYPNKNHGIYGGMTRFHLWNKVLEFMDRNL